MSGGSGMERGALLVLAVVSCVAALVVVPEVRCAVGLEPDQRLRAWRCAPRQAVVGPIPLSAPLTEAASVEDAIRGIRGEFDVIEKGLPGFASFRDEMPEVGGDSAYATVYVDGGEIRKIRSRVYQGGLRSSIQLYYAGGELFFAYQVVTGADGGTLDEQRFYFRDGRLIRWLDARRATVPPGAAGYAGHERRLTELARTLMERARASGAGR